MTETGTQTPQDSDEKSQNQACSSSELPSDGGLLQSPRKSMGSRNKGKDDDFEDTLPPQEPPEEPPTGSSKNSDKEPSEKVKLF